MVSATTDELRAAFHKRFAGNPMLFRAPGRVNLIGEHTDYNLGFVMPIAIDLACSAAIAADSSSGTLSLHSEELGGYSLAADSVAAATPRKEWTDYVIGVARQLPPVAANLLIHSTVPSGSGLSSSAALEVSSALALAAAAGRTLDKLELVRICHRAENEFVGMPCGIMDQFISVFGKANRAIRLDCRSLEYEEVPLPENVSIIAVNSMVKHELGSSAYRHRVAECKAAVEAIQRAHPDVKSLRDATGEMLGAVEGVAHKRARHIVGENARVLAFAAAARRAELEEMGRLFVESHRSLQYDYEVSCEELDFLVDTAIGLPGVYGARMTGGGFGGCTVNLVAPEQTGEFKRKISENYVKRFQVEARIYDCQPSDGAGPIK